MPRQKRRWPRLRSDWRISAGRIIGFGWISVDERICVEVRLSYSKGRNPGRWRLHGGNVATALAAAAHLGAEADHVGWRNDGAQGDESAAAGFLRWSATSNGPLGAPTETLAGLADQRVVPQSFAPRLTGVDTVPAILAALWSETERGGKSRRR